MKKIILILVVISVILASAIGLYFSGNFTKTELGKYDEFAKCLTEKGVVMYGAYWCPHCANQKNDFGSSWKYIKYVECDSRGDNGNPQLCKEKGITGYPTWFINGEYISGEVPFQTLSYLSGCGLT